ncbi:hypothetical protein EJB05_33840, partial [Eragrostis curvula]
MNLITLRDGFNFLLATRATDGHGATSTSTANKYLFLLHVARQSLGRDISMVCIDPDGIAATGNGQGPSSTKEVKCELSYMGNGDKGPHSCHQVIEHYQKSRFRVACTDVSKGMSGLDGCFQFVVPDSVAADIDTIMVTARIVTEEIDA